MNPKFVFFLLSLTISDSDFHRYNELVVDKSASEEAQFQADCKQILTNAIDLFEETNFPEGKKQCLSISKSFENLPKREVEEGYKSMLEEDNSILLTISFK